MNELRARVEAAIRSAALLPAGASTLVAVSGGLDSMVLLALLRDLAPTRSWRLVVGHLNHQLRGRSSNEDEKLVRSTATAWHLPCLVERVDVAKLAARTKTSLEMAARQARHSFLARSARRRRLRLIALGHHSDDQVELFLLRMLRGAGRLGLAGMKWRSPSPVDPAISLIRPLLGCTRADLAAFATSNRIPYREDESNRSPDILRNRIRTELLPLLTRHYQPALPSIILREMDLLGAEDDWMSDCADAWRKKPAASPFRDLPVALQRLLLRDELIRQEVEPDFAWVEHLRLRPGQTLLVSGGRCLVHPGQGQVRVMPPEPETLLATSQRIHLQGLSGTGTFDGMSWSWRARTPSKLLSKPNRSGVGQEYFDADRVGDPIILRHWKPGDRFQPSGLSSAVKLQDLFTNAKVPKAWRHRLTVATDSRGDIWWVEGLRIAQQFKLQPRTRRVLRWSWTRPAPPP